MLVLPSGKLSGACAIHLSSELFQLAGNCCICKVELKKKRPFVIDGNFPVRMAVEKPKDLLESISSESPKKTKKVSFGKNHPTAELSNITQHL